MTPTERQRIESEAKKYSGGDDTGVWPNRHQYIGYIAGATAEHERYSNRASALLPQLFGEQLELERDKARNQAIQECIDIVSRTQFYLGYNPTEALEQLKTKP